MIFSVFVKEEFAVVNKLLLVNLYIFAPIDIFPFILPIVTLSPASAEARFSPFFINSETVYFLWSLSNEIISPMERLFFNVKDTYPLCA